MNQPNVEEQKEQIKEPELPFNNLYLNSGFINGENKLWMYVFTVFFVMFAYAGGITLLFTPLAGILLSKGYTLKELEANEALIFDPEATGIDRNYILLLQLLIFLLVFGAFYTSVRIIHRKPLLSLLTSYEKFRYARFFFAFATWALLIVVAFVAELCINPGQYKFDFNVVGFLVSTLIVITLMPVQSGIEEVLFRGYLMQGLSQVFKNGIIPLLITSLLFGLAHISNPEVEEFGWEIMIPYYVSFAFFMGALTLLDEGLELALGIHMANNIISSLIVSDKHSVVQSYALFSNDSKMAEFEILMWFLMAALAFFAFWRRYRWKNFKLILR